MGQISTAFRAFFAALLDAGTAARIANVLSGKALPEPSAPLPESGALPTLKPSTMPPQAVQSDAITLLAALQREARLIDFLQEDLSNYADEQIGAAVREVQRDSRQVLQRFFALKPVLQAEEGARIEIPAGFEPGKFRLSGNVSGSAPFHGTLQHHGWEAAQCELPCYTGSAAAANVVAPAEVEIA
jgi:hypothetical protein